MIRHIIIVGAARSGTKILRDVLAEASGVGCVPYDIGFVWRYGNERVPHDVLDPATVTPRTQRFVHRYVDRYARSGGDVVIEKTVGNSLRVPFVHAVMPDAAFVHVVRDGLDVAESARRQWSTPPDRGYLLRKVRHFPLRLVPSYGREYALAQLSLLRRARGDTPRGNVNSRGDTPRAPRGSAGTWGPRYPGIDDDVASCDLLTVCARQWRTSVSYASRDLAQVSAPVVDVRYEHLVSEPLATLGELLDRLGLPAASEDRRRAAARLEAGRAGAGPRSLDSSELEMISAELGTTLTTFGYREAR
jgi:Sulfotransferase family